MASMNLGQRYILNQKLFSWCLKISALEVVQRRQRPPGSAWCSAAGLGLTSCAVWEFCDHFPFTLNSLNINPLDFRAGAHLECPSKVISLAVLFSVVPCTAQRGEGALGLPSALAPWGWLLGGKPRVAEGCWCCWRIDTFGRVSEDSGISPPHPVRQWEQLFAGEQPPQLPPLKTTRGFVLVSSWQGSKKKNQMPFCTSGIYQGRESP